MISDPKYNELRGALLNMEAVLEATSVTDPSFDSLLTVYQDTRATFLKYANESFDKLAQELDAMAGRIKADLEAIKNKSEVTGAVNSAIGIAKSIGGLLALAGLPNPFISFL